MHILGVPSPWWSIFSQIGEASFSNWFLCMPLIHCQTSLYRFKIISAKIMQINCQKKKVLVLWFIYFYFLCRFNSFESEEKKDRRIRVKKTQDDFPFECWCRTVFARLGSVSKSKILQANSFSRHTGPSQQMFIFVMILWSHPLPKSKFFFLA